jgi:hypothetical protein
LDYLKVKDIGIDFGKKVKPVQTARVHRGRGYKKDIWTENQKNGNNVGSLFWIGFLNKIYLE